MYQRVRLCANLLWFDLVGGSVVEKAEKGAFIDGSLIRAAPVSFLSAFLSFRDAGSAACVW
jgi:hypothetical protein